MLVETVVVAADASANSEHRIELLTSPWLDKGTLRVKKDNRIYTYIKDPNWI